MTRTRLVFLSALTVAACGGRSSLHVQVADGGRLADSAAQDGKRDGSTDSARPSDGSADATTPDVFAPDAYVPSDLGSDAARRDNRPADLSTLPDIRPIDGLPPDAFRRDAGRDGSDGSSDASRVDQGRPDSPIVVPDARDGGLPDGAGDAAPTLQGIELSPPSPTIVVHVPYTGLVVTATFSDGTSSDVTASSTFSSSDTTVVQIAGQTLNGQKAGTATVTASYQGRTATAQVTVNDAPLQSISIDGVVPVSVGQFILVTATGVFADGTKQDITAQATWTSSDTTLATVSFDGSTSKEKVTGVQAGSLTLTAALLGITGKAAVTVTAASITRIDLTPAQPILQRGVSQLFQATATYSDGTTGDVTLQARWASSDTGVATVAANAADVVVRAIGAGTATISATVGTVTGSTSVTVTTPTLLSIAVTPAAWAPNVGGTQAFTATGTYSDNTTADLTVSVSWSSSNSNVVSVSNAAGQKGQATALAPGVAQVQATLSGVTGVADVKVSASPLVSITVTPDPLDLVLGIKGTLTATGNYQNGTAQDLTSQVTWTISDPSIATISNATGTAGQVTGVAVGTTTAVAALGSVAGKALVTVSQAKLTAITVTPDTANVTAGAKQQFIATGTYDNGATPDLTTQVTWSSSDITVAQVSNAAGSNGLATSLVQGRCTITAALGGISGTATLTVDAPLLSSIMIAPTAASIEVGGTQTFTVTAVYQNGTTAAVAGTWASSNTDVATIAASGGGRRANATGVAAGTATIFVTYQGLSDSATLTVTEVPTLVGLTITPSTIPTMLVGTTQQLQANAVFSNGSTSVVTTAASWTSSDANVASVSNGGGGGPGGGGGRGLVTAIGPGTAVITATYNGLVATVSASVRDPTPTGLLITPDTATVRVGGTQQFVAVLTLEDGTTQIVTTSTSWTTSDGSIASISTGGGGGPGGGGGRGLATGVAPGTVTVTATYRTLTATASLTVTAAQPVSLVVTPPTASIQVGQTQAFVATMVYDDNTTATVTTQASWTSSDPAVAAIQTAGGGPGGGRPTAGLATAIATGISTISASYDGFTGTADLTVVDPPLAYVQVTPTNPNIPVGATQQFTATAVFADSSTRDVTGTATWSSSDTSIAVVLNSGTSVGRATALAEGSTMITATYKGVSGSSVLSVAGSVQSVSVTPTNPTAVLGVPVSFAANALLSNGSTLVVTGNATWLTSDATVATVTATGLATPVSSGATTITASYLGKSGTSTLTVSSATLSSIAITPNPLSLATGASQQMSATGDYSDGSSYDLTDFATWLSSAITVATVSNASGSRGLLTAVAAGSTSVTATFQAVTSYPAPITVTP
jgi:uncharacterized protein YjdB